MYSREKEKSVVLIPYKYFGMESGFKEVDVFVIEGKESPDPSKLMLWGRGCNGIVSDFKRSFERKGAKIPLGYKTKALSAAGEDKDMLDAVDSFIKTNLRC